MVDSFNMQDPVAVEPEAPAKSGLAGFFESRTGKIVAGAVIIVVLVGVIGAMAAYFLLGSLFQPSTDGGVVTPPPAAGTTQTAEVPTERAPLPPEDTYTFRNIFAPTVKPAVPTTSTSGSTDGSETIPANTLVLQSVTTVDGVPTANLYWNGEVYALAEGGQIPDTPWEVLDISGSTVVMLYGDSRMTLTVGQGVGK